MMEILKVVGVTLKEYHKRNYVYSVLLLCVIPVVVLGIGYGRNPETVEYVVNSAEAGVGLFCTFAMILLGMQTYSPKLESGEILLDITKPVGRVDYFLGKVLSNIIVGLICTGGVILSSAVFICKYGVINQLVLRTIPVMVIPLFMLSVTSLINLYVPAKATGVSAFVLYMVYGSVTDYLAKNGIDPHIMVMDTSFSVISTLVLFISFVLILCGTLLFNKKEL